MSRRLVLPCTVLVLLAIAPASAAKAPASWAQPQIQALVSAGIMGNSASDFHPNDPLTRIALEQLTSGLTHTAPALVTALRLLMPKKQATKLRAARVSINSHPRKTVHDKHE